MLILSILFSFWSELHWCVCVFVDSLVLSLSTVCVDSLVLRLSTVCGWLGVVSNNRVCNAERSACVYLNSEISVCVGLTFVRGGVGNF